MSVLVRVRVIKELVLGHKLIRTRTRIYILFYDKTRVPMFYFLIATLNTEITIAEVFIYLCDNEAINHAYVL